ncbi:hypothetical protein ACFVUS_24295 [Nocardia sp. NPDC058058]|uniref:hypothetical protein n=1 Tax=Nocardia sp. NPDC058058 TaxID=3346317 RepID=UPI0036D8552B
MTQTMESTRIRTAGIIADGAFKVLLGVGALGGASTLGRLLGVPVWMLVVAGGALVIGGGVEIRYVTRRPARRYTALMVAYDSGWVLAASAGLLLAWQGAGFGGEVWVGYQMFAPIAFAVLLISGITFGSRLGASRRA